MSCWYKFQPSHVVFVNNLNVSPPIPPVHMKCYTKSLYNVTLSDLSEQTMRSAFWSCHNFDQEFHFNIFISPAMTPYQTIVEHHMNTFGSVLLTETQMVRSQFVMS